MILSEIGEVSKYIRGITFKPTDVVKAHSDDSVVCMRTKNVQKDLDAADLIAVAPKFVKREEQYLRSGDLLISSANSWNLVGKVCFISELPYKATAGGFISIVRPDDEKVDSRYFYHLLNSDRTQHHVRLCGRQTTNISNLDRSRFLKLKIPTPPIAEQRRIAAILDKADGIRRDRRQAIQYTEELLRSAFLDMFGDPVTNPKDWTRKPLGKVAKFLGGGTPSRKRADYFDGAICWASSKDMSVDVLTDTQEHITQDAIENSSTKLIDQECLLIVVKSKILMRRLPVARVTVPICFNQDIKAIVPDQGWMTRYVHRHLIFGEKVLLQQARGANTEGLTLDHLRTFPIMMPPQSSIKSFAELDIHLERTMKRNESLINESDSLFNSLLQRAFKGDL